MAAGRFATLAALLTGTAAAAPAAPAAGSDPLASLDLDDATRAQLGTEISAFVEQEKTSAFKAGNDRAVKVMGSDKGKANPASALALLGNEKLSALSAEDIIAAVPDAPKLASATAVLAPEPGDEGAAAAAAAAAGGTAAGGSKAHEERLAAAPKIALGNRASTDATVEETSAKGGDKPKAIALWGNVQGITDGGKTGANGAVVGAAGR